MELIRDLINNSNADRTRNFFQCSGNVFRDLTTHIEYGITKVLRSAQRLTGDVEIAGCENSADGCDDTGDVFVNVDDPVAVRLAGELDLRKIHAQARVTTREEVQHLAGDEF